MSTNHKVGDLALVDYGTGTEVMMRDYWGWTSTSTEILDSENVVESVRPLVVIDPEDREQVEGILRDYDRRRGIRTPNDPSNPRVAALQAALREFANPTPPKPDEPTGLGAVVEDGSSNVWVRWSVTHDEPWTNADDGDVFGDRAFDEIAAVKVLSAGWVA